MTLRISGKNLDVGDALRQRAETHLDGVVAKYFNGRYDGHLTLMPDGAGYKADCVIHLDAGATLQANGLGGDPTGAYEVMANHIETRLRRYNRKLKARRTQTETGQADGVAQAYILGSADGHDELHEDYSPPVIAESTAALKHLSVEEAVMELDLSGTDVVVFRHAGHGGLNVVYRRADGNIGWIDPALNVS
jgi:ribosomal subunit interface protein